MAADRIAPADARPAAAPIKLVVADVDGTLVTTAKVLTPRTQAAVGALGAAGIAFAIVSSRPPRGLAMLIEPLHITTPVAGFNGGVIARPDLTPIEQHLLAPEVAQRAAQLLRAAGLDAWVFADDAWYVRDPDGPHVAHEVHTVQFAPVVTRDFGAALVRSGKVVGVSNDHALVARAEISVRAALGAVATVIRSQLYYVDVTHPLANKGAALAALARVLAVPPAAIATIGDGENDVLMFAGSGLSIAMGNATDAVKAQAQFTTDSCDADGFAAAIERIVLPRAAAGTGAAR